ncbi:cell division protein ZipA C-terminal FtsZ-binding domain-containing protein [Paenalcaligenes hominis]|uniref:cell division protein ZipA C-terminal FtsZ-binding domain-containing protein n=1 Tax=Paenalcaligenes hominis TaxID=643674 RepID=UPI003524214D
MSDLKIALVALGAILILLVLLFNWWQDRRVRNTMKDKFPEVPADPLMTQLEAERREPTVRIAETLAQPKAEPAVLAEDIDAATEAVIDVQFPKAVPGAELMDLLRAYLRVETKPVRLFALSTQGEHHAYPHEAEQYVGMQLAMLLANRKGPLSEIDWSRLWMAAQNLAQQLDGTVDGPEQQEVIERAQQLDNLCANLDAQVGLSLRLAEPLATAEVRQVALNAGFMEYGKQLGWLASSGIPRFTLLFDGKPAMDLHSAQVNRLDLLLDVPNSPKDTNAFSRMATVGRDLAVRLDAELIDDQGQPLTDHYDDEIDQQLYQIYEQLEDAGFNAGETRTLRVFT